MFLVMIAGACAIVFVITYVTIVKSSSKSYNTKVMIKVSKVKVKLTDLGGGIKVVLPSTGDEFFTARVTPFMDKSLGQAGYVWSIYPVYQIYYLHNGKTYVQYVLGTLDDIKLYEGISLFNILSCFSRDELDSYMEDLLMKRTDGSNLFLGNEREVICRAKSEKQINRYLGKMKLGVVYLFK